MDISQNLTQSAMSMCAYKTSCDIGVGVMKKALDCGTAQAQGLLDMMKQPANTSFPAETGRLLDVRA